LEDGLNRWVRPADFEGWLERYLRALGQEERRTAEGEAPGDTWQEVTYRQDRLKGLTPRTLAVMMELIAGPSQSMRESIAEHLATTREPDAFLVQRAAERLIEGWEPEAMLLILNRAGVLPELVRRLVEELAGGRTSPGWARRGILSVEHARLLGVPADGSALQSLADQLLRTVRKNQGASAP
jgi:hypothetical protein